MPESAERPQQPGRAPRSRGQRRGRGRAGGSQISRQPNPGGDGQRSRESQQSRGASGGPQRGRNDRGRALTPEERSARDAARAARRERRLASVPEITYPEHLPVVERRDDIAAAIRDNQVVVIAGETGSGKTTQIPKICLELGRGIDGQIGHTQPRRIAARSVAERLAHELNVEIGGAVGYQVRFTDSSSRDTLVKVMTDGILLAELQRDRDLRRYDTIIIDEAHERSLNIDFILGYLKQLLPRRRDLKVIVTSATIDPQRFAEHFADAGGTPAPIIEVSGRTYPVEVRYRPLVRTQPSGRTGESVEVEVDQVTGIVEAVEELWTEAGAGDGSDQDILVFCSGEREIRDAVDALNALALPSTQVLPLYGRLSAAEQHRIFSSHPGRRVVVSTNVAETSLTVPGIRYVVDSGTARISRYSQRTKVQRLPIEAISQASAAQRSGRCGRLSDGIAIRLYSEEDFEARPEFTDPEIARTNLASVILQMISLGLGDIARFPFVDPPDSRMVTDGLRLLHELHAIEEADTRHASTGGRDGGVRGSGAGGDRRRLTRTGHDIARIPVDPRLARMLVEADRLGALREVIVIVAALSIQDVRERPSEGADATRADQHHARFKDEHSDFTTLLNVWEYVREQQRARSGSAFRRMCKDEYLHYLRIREWQDLVTQLKTTCTEIGLRPNVSPGSTDAIHHSLLTGLLSQVGAYDREKRDYLGARGARFAIAPGSVLRRVNPEWVMSAELVETSRLWARTNAVTDATSIEEAAAHLVKRSYSEPRWSRGRAGAIADERVTLYGIPLVIGRRVGLATIDPEASRDLFIRHALVEGDWDTPHRFFHDNRKLVDKLSELESRARRRDLLVDEHDLFAFYDERIPADIVSGAHFDAWWKTARRENPDLLTFTEDVLVSDVAAVAGGSGEQIDEALRRRYPHVWEQGELRLRLTYEFDPGGEADGVTCHIPLEILNQVDNTGFDWLVPGMREELAIALVKSLPKATRKQFVPAPDRARAALAAISDADGAPEDGSGPDSGLAFSDELARGLYIVTGHRVPPGEWDIARIPGHLRMNFVIEDTRRRPFGEGGDLLALQDELAPRVRTTMKKAAGELERTGLTTWTFGELPSDFEGRRGGQTVRGFPALVDHGDTVAVEVLATPRQQETATKLGLRRLILLNTTAPWQRILGLLSNTQRLALGNNPHGSVQALLDDVLACAVDAIVAEHETASRGRVHTPEQFDAALAAVKREVVPHVIEIVDAVAPVLDRALQVRLALDAMKAPRVAALRDDLSAQLDALVYPGFVARTGMAQLRHLPRYLQGMLHRIEKAPLDLARDARDAETIQRVETERHKVLDALPSGERDAADVRALRWMVEELRISLFAQRLGTNGPVSEKRIYTAMDSVEDTRA
ncbi:MAG: ATP-dependent RNA helicase HrpA [Dermatophilus congolensis]|nr:ATP-dependent RNA helicase HrpA [Dermatophilus congolensis]